MMSNPGLEECPIKKLRLSLKVAREWGSELLIAGKMLHATSVSGMIDV